MSARLKRGFFRRDAETLARALLGQTLVRRLEDGQELCGRIVEVEAYVGVADRAAHTFGGRRTAANQSMWLDGGYAYVYFIYGMHWCLNVVASRAKTPTACLIRALEPVAGLASMRRHRAGKVKVKRLKETDLCSGPAKLTQALKIDGRLDGLDLTTDERLFLRRGQAIAPEGVVATPRIGVAYAKEWAGKPLRFLVDGNPNVSASRPRR